MKTYYYFGEKIIEKIEKHFGQSLQKFFYFFH